MLIAKTLCVVVMVCLLGSVLGWVMGGYSSGEAQALEGARLRVGEDTIDLYAVEGLLSQQQCGFAGARWACGVRAQQALAELVATRTVRCFTQAMSPTGAKLGVCFVGLKDVGRTLIEAGWGLADPSADGRYDRTEALARARLAGVWRSLFEAPAYWRLSHPEPSPESSRGLRPKNGSGGRRALAMGLWVLGVVLVGGLALGLLCIGHWNPKALQRWRKGRMRGVLAVLQRIGVERGPAAQRAYLRQVGLLVLMELVWIAMERRGQRLRGMALASSGPDAGRCWSDGETHLIHVQRYGRRAGVTELYRFVERCEMEHAKGLWVHLGRAGPDGSRAVGPAVTIVSGAKLLEWLGVRSGEGTTGWVDFGGVRPEGGDRAESLP